MAILVMVALAGSVLVVVAVALHEISQPVMNHVTLTVTNSTPAAVTDAGFQDSYNDRCISVGPLPPGQSRTVSVDYNENDCPIGFSYGQAGQTYRSRLGDQLLNDGDVYSVTLSTRSVTVSCVNKGRPTTRFVQAHRPSRLNTDGVQV